MELETVCLFVVTLPDSDIIFMRKRWRGIVGLCYVRVCMCVPVCAVRRPRLWVRAGLRPSETGATCAEQRRTS